VLPLSHHRPRHCFFAIASSSQSPSPCIVVVTAVVITITVASSLSSPTKPLLLQPSCLYCVAVVSSSSPRCHSRSRHHHRIVVIVAVAIAITFESSHCCCHIFLLWRGHVCNLCSIVAAAAITSTSSLSCSCCRWSHRHLPLSLSPSHYCWHCHVIVGAVVFFGHQLRHFPTVDHDHDHVVRAETIRNKLLLVPSYQRKYSTLVLWEYYEYRNFYSLGRNIHLGPYMGLCPTSCTAHGISTRALC